MSTTLNTKTKVFFTGATGYIGGAVLERLLQHPDAPMFDFTLLVRNPEKVEKFKKEFGLNAVVGSLNDAQLLEDLTAEADLVFHMADSDGLEAATSILRGSKRRFQKTGNPQIFIHTSGTGLFGDDAAGLRSSDVIWDDSNADQLEQLPPTALHRNVDLELIQADKEGYIQVYIIAPAVIYGLATGKLVDAGLSNKFPILLPLLLNAALKRGETGVIGKGLNIWPNIHIDDTADLYIVLYNAIKANPKNIGHGREGYYLGIADEYTYYQFGKELAQVLVDLGKIENPEPTTFTDTEIQEYGAGFTGTNSRGVANRSKSIGWKPTKFTVDFFASIRPEVEEIVLKGLVVSPSIPQ